MYVGWYRHRTLAQHKNLYRIHARPCVCVCVYRFKGSEMVCGVVIHTGQWYVFHVCVCVCVCVSATKESGIATGVHVCVRVYMHVFTISAQQCHTEVRCRWCW